jgi:thioredoxin reductase (NADPH)
VVSDAGCDSDFKFEDLGNALRKIRIDLGVVHPDAAGIYLAGVIVAGMHTNEIFIENGRFHGQLIAEAVAKFIK